MINFYVYIIMYIYIAYVKYVISKYKMMYQSTAYQNLLCSSDTYPD